MSHRCSRFVYPTWAALASPGQTVDEESNSLGYWHCRWSSWFFYSADQGFLSWLWLSKNHAKPISSPAGQDNESEMLYRLACLQLGVPLRWFRWVLVCDPDQSSSDEVLIRTCYPAWPWTQVWWSMISRLCTSSKCIHKSPSPRVRQRSDQSSPKGSFGRAFSLRTYFSASLTVSHSTLHLWPSDVLESDCHVWGKV